MRTITRARPSLSCYACRRRKIRCSRQHPTCETCLKVNEECVYDTQPIESKAKNRRMKGSNQSVEHKSGKPETSGKPTSSKGLARPGISSDTHSLKDSPSNNTATTTSLFVSSNRYPVRPSLAVDDSSLSKSPQELDWETSWNAKDIDCIRTGIERFEETYDYWQVYSNSDEDHRSSSAESPRQDSRVGSACTMPSCDYDRSSANKPPNQSYLEPTNPHSVQASDRISSPIEGEDAPRKRVFRRSIEEQQLMGTPGQSCALNDRWTRHSGSALWALAGSDVRNSENRSVLAHNRQRNQTFDCNELPEQFDDHSMFLPRTSSFSMSEEAGYTSSVSSVSASSVSSNSDAELFKLARLLPPEPICNAVLQSFLTTIHPIFPLFHIPTFRKDYNSFWQYRIESDYISSEDNLRKSAAFLPLLFAVLFGGIISAPSELLPRSLSEGHSRLKLKTHLRDITILALQICQFPRRSSLNSLTAFLIIHSCSVDEKEHMTGPEITRTALRASQDMGLHQDETIYGLDEMKCEFRRRVWRHILVMDVQSATSFGVPCSISEEYYDYRIGRGVPDKNVGSPAMLLAEGRYETAKVVRQILGGLHDMRLPTKSRLVELGKIVSTLKVRLDEMIMRIPAKGLPEKGFVSLGEKESSTFPTGSPAHKVQNQPAFNSWARIMLNMLSDSTFITLYQPYLKAEISTKLPGIWISSFKLCESFLRNFVQLSRLPEFNPYHWYCPGVFQPLQATTILLTYLYEQPIIGDPSVTRFLIDEVFDIFRDHIIFPGQREDLERHDSPTRARKTWKHLDRLRKKGYIRVGWQVEALPESGPSGICKPDARMDGTSHTERSDWQRSDWYSTSGSHASLEDAHRRRFTPKSLPAPQQVRPSSRSQTNHGMLPMIDLQTAEDVLPCMSPKSSLSSFDALYPSPLATPTIKGDRKASIELDDYDDYTFETGDAILHGNEEIITEFPSLEPKWFENYSEEGWQL